MAASMEALGSNNDGDNPVNDGQLSSNHYNKDHDNEDPQNGGGNRPGFHPEPCNVNENIRRNQHNIDTGDNGGESHRNMGLYETNQVFVSRDALVDWVVTRGKENGWVINTRRSKKNKVGEVAVIWLKCDRGGKNKSIATSRKCCSKRINCPFSLSGHYKLNMGGWLLTVHSDIHNHEPSEHMEGHAFAMRLSKNELSLVKQLMEQNMEPRDILLTLKNQNADNVSCLRTIYNTCNKINKIKKTNKAQPLVQEKVVVQPVQRDSHVEQHIPSPPHLAPQSSPQIMTRPDPLTVDYMREMLHLQREQHAFAVWQAGLLQTWAQAHQLQYPAPPIVEPFVPTLDLDPVEHVEEHDLEHAPEDIEQR